MDLSRITPLLITKNEEANLERTLARLSWARRIVVVDSHSTDSTAAILARYPAVEVYTRRFDTFADQCNFGLGKIETEWVLSMDADYVLTDAFVREMVDLDSRADAYAARFIYCIDGKGLRGSLYPPRTVLYRPSRARYEADGHAHRLRVDGAVEPLQAPIRHDDRKPLAVWLEAQRRYAVEEAGKLRAGDDLTLADRLRARRWIAPLLTPLYCLFVKGLLLDGPAGWLYTAQRTYAEILLTLTLSEADLATHSGETGKKAVLAGHSNESGRTPASTHAIRSHAA